MLSDMSTKYLISFLDKCECAFIIGSMTVKDAALVSLDNAQRALSKCKNVMQAKKIMDAAEAARIYLARTHASLEAVNHATEIRTLAERQMGEFLATTPKNGGHKFAGGKGPRPPAEPPTLEEMGISKSESVLAQRMAKVPDEEFEKRLEAGKAAGKLTRESILNPPEVKPQGTVEIIPPRRIENLDRQTERGTRSARRIAESETI